MSVPASFKRKELKNALPIYEKIEDCLLGEDQIKKQGEKYLPSPDCSMKSEQLENGYENIRRKKGSGKRYDDYLKRANFFNATARTLEGLVGLIFSIDPFKEVPVELEKVCEDANGENIDIVQLAKRSCYHTLSYGRSGIFVDFPDTGGAVSKDDVDKGIAKPTFKIYKPHNIINWDTVKRGSKTIYSLIVLEEVYYERKESSWFEFEEKKQWRVLSLGGSKQKDENKDKYVVEIFKQKDGSADSSDLFVPTDHSGNAFDTIPFFFTGAENNDHEIDKAPLIDIANLNISHYRNSADYEESAYIVGQPTLYMTGLTDAWVKNIFQNDVTLGSRNAIPLPERATAGLLQANPNILPFEAMVHKEKQMIALGAKMVEDRKVERTATEASQDKASENSILANVSKNVSQAFTNALKFAFRFQSSASEPEILFKLNDEFNLGKGSMDNLMKIVSMWQQGILTFDEAREHLKKTSVATEDNKKAKTLIMSEREVDLELEDPEKTPPSKKDD